MQELKPAVHIPVVDFDPYPNLRPCARVGALPCPMGISTHEDPPVVAGSPGL